MWVSNSFDALNFSAILPIKVISVGWHLGLRDWIDLSWIFTHDHDFFQLMKQIENLGEKNRERPLCYKYSIKARALIHAHLSRIPLNPETLDRDRMYVIKKCPALINEMINCVVQLIKFSYYSGGGKSRSQISISLTFHVVEDYHLNVGCMAFKKR